MTLVAKIDGVTLPDGALLIGGAPNSEVPGGISGLLTAAWYGEAPSVGIVLDDADGDLEDVLSLGSLHTFTVDETACTGKERIWSGWLTASRISRGPYRDGPSRIWDIDIIDMNWAFNLMTFRAASAHRPAETDIVRVDFGRASAPMANTPLADNGRFNVTDNPVAFDEADYVAKYPIELFASVAGTAGKNFYAYWDHDEDELSMHYDLVGVGPSSTLSISNLIADTSSTCFYPFVDAELRRDGAWKVTGMLFNYKGAYAYGINQTTIDSLSPTEFSPVEFQRDEVYQTDRVGKLATAQALIARMLEERAQDRDTVQCSIRVPAAQVNLVEAGDVINVKFTHLPGYEAGVDLPVIRRNVVPTPGRTDSYDIHLELSGNAKPMGPGGGPPGVFVPPREEPCDPTSAATVQSGSALCGSPSGGSANATLGATLTVGNTLVVWIASRAQSADYALNGGISITGNVDPQEASFQQVRGSMWYMPVTVATNTVSIFGGSTQLRIQYVELEGTLELVTYGTTWLTDQGCSDPFPIPNGFGGVTLTADAILIGGYIARLNVSDSFNLTADSPAVQLAEASGSSAAQTWLGRLDAVGAGSYDFDGTVATGGCLRGYVAAVAAFSCTPDDTDPLVCMGQGLWSDWTYLQDGDGVTDDFTIPCPYADGGLRVKVDGLEIEVGLTETDGAAGQFSLDFAPKAAVGDSRAEKVYYKYQGR